MDDVNANVSEAQPVEETTVQPTTENQTTEVEANVPEVIERQVPISVLQKERKQRQEFQRKLAELESKQNVAGYDPTDVETVMAHPMYQELLIKQAKQELTDYARTTLDSYPNLHPAVKKAILANVRGFVNENTRDIETAKIDLQEYIDSIAEEQTTQPTPKTFPVASTNVSKTEIPGARPAEIQKILDKPLDKWTDKDEALIEEFSKTHK